MNYTAGCNRTLLCAVAHSFSGHLSVMLVLEGAVRACGRLMGGMLPNRHKPKVGQRHHPVCESDTHDMLRRLHNKECLMALAFVPSSTSSDFFADAKLHRSDAWKVSCRDANGVQRRPRACAETFCNTNTCSCTDTELWSFDCSPTTAPARGQPGGSRCVICQIWPVIMLRSTCVNLCQPCLTG